MNKKKMMMMTVTTLALAMTCALAWGADPLPGGARGINCGGMLHYISLSSSQHVGHY